MSGLMKFTKFALGNLFSKPATSKYPAVKPEYTERTRGKVMINIDDCLFCGLCAKKCVADAITVDRATKTWTIERMGCVQCSNCVENCPKNCLYMDRYYPEPDAEKYTESYVQPVKEAENASGGIAKADLDKCVYCTLCAKNCPQGAITVDRQAKTWEIDEESCVSCGLCVEKCPKKCISLEETEAKTTAAGGIAEADLNSCVYCTLCAKNCPQEAIKVDRQAKTWEIDKEACIGCGLCAEKCPKKCISLK